MDYVAIYIQQKIKLMLNFVKDLSKMNFLT
jgi:hypothetical protein